MSASVATDRANLRRRGTLLGYIFANQGWGSFVGSLATIIVLLCYKTTMDTNGHTSKVDGGACASHLTLGQPPWPCGLYLLGVCRLGHPVFLLVFERVGLGGCCFRS